MQGTTIQPRSVVETTLFGHANWSVVVNDRRWSTTVVTCDCPSDEGVQVASHYDPWSKGLRVAVVPDSDHERDARQA